MRRAAACRGATARALLLVAAAQRGAADVYDYFAPQHVPGCSGGCAAWASAGQRGKTSQAEIDAMFISGKVPADAGAQCAMPGATAGAHECDCKEKDAITYMTDSYAGPWCFCDDGSTQYCAPRNSTVEQLNLQLAAADTVVAAFVTYEALPQGPAVAMLGTSKGALTQVEGVSHVYKPPGRTYVMHYVTFRGLQPRQTYYYKVKSGSAACEWTDVFSFRAPYASGVTRIATYGDMGHSRYNNMGNLRDDCAAGTIDAVVHMGDHGYNLGQTNDRRGDAYMNVFQPVLRACPWVPIIGNHEKSDDGDHGARYEQIALGESIGEGALGVRSTAYTALGQHLTLGRLYAAASLGAVPSGTSRYTSTDIGLLHIAGIDLQGFDDKQKAWLEEDLKAANANRAAVPWIMVAGHYPVYSQKLQAYENMSAAGLLGEAGEFAQERRYEPCATPGCRTVREWHAEVTGQLEPLLLQYGVDLYNAGHIHWYEASWPMRDGKVCKQSYDNPTCPVYVVEGNGGVPGCSKECTVDDCSGESDWCRVHGAKKGSCGAYGRITIKDAHTLIYEHVQNSDGKVKDNFTITQASHGPFAPGPPPTPPGPGPSPPAGTCAAIGCGNHGSCWCKGCPPYDNCCADYKDVCGGLPTPAPPPAPAGSCAEIGCGNHGSCYCYGCPPHNHCCADYKDVCGGPTPAP